MQFKAIVSSVLLAGLILVSPVAAAKTLSQLSTDLTFLRAAVTRIQEEDANATKEDARESSSELFPAMEGAKVKLTVAQQSLVRRCEKMKKMNTRCKALLCRLTGEQCRK